MFADQKWFLMSSDFITAVAVRTILAINELITLGQTLSLWNLKFKSFKETFQTDYQLQHRT